MYDARRRRWAAVGAATVLAAAVAGCGQPAGQNRPRQPAAEARPPYVRVEELPEDLGADGTTITVGDPKAPLTVHLYEDPRCPYCRQFETTGGGPALRKATLGRQAKTAYTLASFLDDRGGSGSKKAVNALRAALEQGKFAEYHQVLYASRSAQSAEGYTDAVLLALAKQVRGLRGPAFDTAVKTMQYRSFVTASEQAYERAGGREEPEGPGTPTAVINGKRIPLEYNQVLLDRASFTELLQRIRARPLEWAAADL